MNEQLEAMQKEARLKDRELLQLAAKAAGIQLEFRVLVWSKGLEYPCYVDNDSVSECAKYEPVIRWNPLTDDGDALRLAVKVGAWPVRGRVIPGDWSETNFIRVVVDGVRFDEMFTDDPYAATRRAIVRAAAEIGKEVK